MAILAGVVAQLLEDQLGHIGPFQGAVALTVLALLLVLPWEENFGEHESGDTSSLYEKFAEGWKTTLSNRDIWKIGLTQALSEGAIYTLCSRLFPFKKKKNLASHRTCSLFLCGCPHYYRWTRPEGYRQGVCFPP